ncbi:MAG: response regulator [Pseudomonadota bacterium]|nr:response regulator [Pseudomonadota bacterium]
MPQLHQPLVALVDDDESVRRSLSLALEKRDFCVATFSRVETFLEWESLNAVDCVVSDLSLPGLGGLELQERLIGCGHGLPIIFITGKGDIPSSVAAIKKGAVDYLEKPFRLNLLIDRINEAIDLNGQRRQADAERSAVLSRYRRLTPREREVMGLLIADPGAASSKQIARRLNVSHRTIDHHRARVLEKMEARSLPELVAIARTHLDAEEPDRSDVG